MGESLLSDMLRFPFMQKEQRKLESGVQVVTEGISPFTSFLQTNMTYIERSPRPR